MNIERWFERRHRELTALLAYVVEDHPMQGRHVLNIIESMATAKIQLADMENEEFPEVQPGQDND